MSTEDIAIKALIEALERTPMFANVPSSEVRYLAESARVVRLRTGDILFNKGDPGDYLYLVRSGIIRVGVLVEDGREVTYAMIKAGWLFGEIAVLDDGPRTADASAATDAELIAIPKHKVQAFLRQDPDQLLRMVRTLCNRIRNADELLEDIFFLSAPGRLAKHLLRLGDTMGENSEDDSVVVRLSQQEMAEQIGIRRECVNRWLTKWEQAGLVSLWRGKITLRDLPGLETLSRSG